MQIYEIEYKSDKNVKTITDLLAFIDTAQEKYCLFKIPCSNFVNCIHIIFSEEHIDYFSPLFLAHNSKRLNKLPAFERAAILGGNPEILKNAKK